MGAPLAQSSRWLFGPVPDLFLGCGLLFGIVSFALSADGGWLFTAMPIGVAALLVSLVSAPHYGATILRVYERREDRRAYFLFSVVATLVLLALVGASFFERWIGSALATIYLTWSGWHYTAQNYGISAMFLRRSGIDVSGASRRLLHTSFTLSYGIVFLVMHGEPPSDGDPGELIRMIPLGLPRVVGLFVVPVVALTYITVSLAWGVLAFRRGARLTDLAPPFTLMALQASWWSLPYLAHSLQLDSGWVAFSWDLRPQFFAWIACGHAAQYLWVTAYFAHQEGRAPRLGRYYLAVLAVGSGIWVLPPFVFGPGLGEFDWNFLLLLAAAINIHHFILDGVIWKLRHAKVARVLIFDGAREANRAREAQDGGWLRRGVWAVAILGVLFAVYVKTESLLIAPAIQRSGDLDALASSYDRQAWHLGVTAYERFLLGRAFEKKGEQRKAIAQYEIAAGMEPRVEPMKRLIVLYDKTGDAKRFVQTCDRLFALPGVRRPMATPEAGEGSLASLGAFRGACRQTARAARSPYAGRGRNSTGAYR